MVRIEPAQTITEALARVGVEIPTACQEGVCGTCLTRVLEGEVDHHGLYLSPAEQAVSSARRVPCWMSRSRARPFAATLSRRAGVPCRTALHVAARVRVGVASAEEEWVVRVPRYSERLAVQDGAGNGHERCGTARQREVRPPRARCAYHSKTRETQQEEPLSEGLNPQTPC